MPGRPPKHRHALAQVATWATLEVLVAGLVAPRPVAGVALGFVAQCIVPGPAGRSVLVAGRQYGIVTWCGCPATVPGAPVTVNALGSAA